MENKGGCWLSVRWYLGVAPSTVRIERTHCCCAGGCPAAWGQLSCRAGTALSGAAEPTAQQGTAAPPCASGSAEQLVSGPQAHRGKQGPGSPELTEVSCWGRCAAAGPVPPGLSQAAPRVLYKLRGFCFVISMFCLVLGRGLGWCV